MLGLPLASVVLLFVLPALVVGAMLYACHREGRRQRQPEPDAPEETS